MVAQTYTDLITPFRDNGTIDTAALLSLVDRQAAAGIDGVIFAADNGESFGLHKLEYRRAIANIASTFPNLHLIVAIPSTLPVQASKDAARDARRRGARGVMLTYTPEKSPQDAYDRLISIASTTALPILLCNDTATNMSPEVAAQVRKRVPNVYAVKESTPQVRRMEEYHSNGMQFFVGSDASAHRGIAQGADGVVSVASNIIPERMRSLVQLAASNPTEALVKYNTLCNLIAILESKHSPVAVKFAASELGLCRLRYRGPLAAPTEDSQRQIRNTLRSYNLLPYVTRAQPLAGALTNA